MSCGNVTSVRVFRFNIANNHIHSQYRERKQKTACDVTFKGVKVKCTLVQVLGLCTGRTAHRGSRSLALLFLDHGIRKGVRGQRHVPAALYPREGPVTHCTGRCVGPRAGLDRCGKSGPDRDSIRGPSSPWPVAIPTELPGP